MPEPMPLAPDALDRIDRWWRAANYLSVGQIYLLDNPMLRAPIAPAHIKPRLLGHFGTRPGLNFVYAHLNRLICARDLDMIFIAGPGHGAPGVVACTWLEGTYSELYPDVSRDEDGVRRLFWQFSLPGGIPSHAAPEKPGSINEGGELGYSLSHAYGAALDNPGLLVACVIGDGEAETGPSATSWHCNKFLSPATDGAVRPILHLNGWKIGNPTVLARIPHDDVGRLLEGCGYAPRFVAGHEPTAMHQAMATALDARAAEIAAIQSGARNGHGGGQAAVCWPMIVLESLQGWPGPKEVDGNRVKGTWRAHQVPIPDMDTPAHVALLDEWMRSYRPDELFDADGRLRPELADLAPVGDRRMSANPHTNGGVLRRPLRLPDYADYAVAVPQPERTDAQATLVLGGFLRDVLTANAEPRNFRILGPDETVSNKLSAVLDVTDPAWDAVWLPGDDHLAPDGRVMEMLSEHTCQGWLEGYLLTGRHGFFSCYKAFVHVVDSMFNQHAKWLKSSRGALATADRVAQLPADLACLDYLLTSHVWRQDHNGFSHQDPGFIDHVVNKKADIVRVYLPPDANTLLWVADHCLRSYDRVNVIVAGRQNEPQWLDMEAAEKQCSAGIGIWPWASSDQGAVPDVVLACAGDVPTLEMLAAAALLRRYVSDVKIRVVHVVDLMTLQPHSQHPHGLPDADYDALFPPGVPTPFDYHGDPWLIHRLAHKRHNHDDLHVRGYQEEGSTTTPFDMAVRNWIDRFHLVADVIALVPGLAARAARVDQAMRDKLAEHEAFIRRHGRDMPEVADWRWRG